LFSLAGAASLALSAVPAAAEGYTTRIETRPFYGATVTLEEGVRVFRPLPVERQVIINPGGQTPLSLGFNETNVYEHRVVKNYNYNEGSNAAPSYRVGSGFYGFGPGFARGNRGGHHNGHSPGGMGGMGGGRH
jgi:hypothetical protein